MSAAAVGARPAQKRYNLLRAESHLGTWGLGREVAQEAAALAPAALEGLCQPLCPGTQGLLPLGSLGPLGEYFLAAKAASSRIDSYAW